MIGFLLISFLFIFGVCLWAWGTHVEYKEEREETIREVAILGYAVFLRLRKIGADKELCDQFWKNLGEVVKSK